MRGRGVSDVGAYRAQRSKLLVLAQITSRVAKTILHRPGNLFSW